MRNIEQYLAEYTNRDNKHEGLLGSSGIFNLHLEPHSIRGWRSDQEQTEILEKHGLPAFNDPINVPREIREQLLEDLEPGDQSMFTFEPGRLYLAFTSEKVVIPSKEQWRMRTFFSLDDCYVLPLTTNLDAPLLKPGSTGPQTYEIINYGKDPLVIDLKRLTCPTARIFVPEPQLSMTGTFSTQTGQKPRLGVI